MKSPSQLLIDLSLSEETEDALVPSGSKDAVQGLGPFQVFVPVHFGRLTREHQVFYR